MILVTGANGHLGRLIVSHLVARLGDTHQLAVSVRNPAQATELAEIGVTVRQGDFDRPDELAQTFAGIDKLVLVSTDGPKEQRIAQHRNAIAAAKAAGVATLNIGLFINAVVKFTIIAFVLFMVVKGINSLKREAAKEPVETTPAPTKEEVLLTEIRDALRASPRA